MNRDRLNIVLISILIIAGCSSTIRYAAKPSGQSRIRNIRQTSGNTITGVASYYGKKFHGRQTANGEIFDMYGLSAAHKTLPLGTRIRVTNKANGKSVEVKVNDRGPFIAGRILDLSFEAARRIGMISTGTAEVEIRILKLAEAQ